MRCIVTARRLDGGGEIVIPDGRPFARALELSGGEVGESLTSAPRLIISLCLAIIERGVRVVTALHSREP